MFLSVLLRDSTDSVEVLALKSEREEERKSDRLRMGVAFENATLRVAGFTICVDSSSGGSDVIKNFGDDAWLSSDDAAGVDGDDSSVGTSGELWTRRRRDPRLSHCTKPPGASLSDSKEMTAI